MQNVRLFILMMGLAVLAVFVPPAARAEAVISGVEVELLANGHERVRFISSMPIRPSKIFRLEDPSRVVIDIPNMPVTGVTLPSDYEGKLLTGIRFGQFSPKIARLVLDTPEPLAEVISKPGAPLVIDLAPADATHAMVEEPATKPVAEAMPATLPPAAIEKKNNTKQSASTGVKPPVKPAAKSTAKAPAPVSSEEKKPLIIVDAGHGGQDPGAIGLHQTQEKDVTLNFARALRQALLRTGRYRVMLTREDDRFISLAERVNIARKANGALFISLHADYNPRPEARGLSIYTLSETASDDEAAALAEHENKSDIIQGIDLNTTDADVANILIDLTQRETMNKSALLADGVVDALHAKVNRLPKTHRFAGFRVLKAPDVPSILIELGFLSNPADERLLLSPEYRDLVVTSVLRGIDRYLAGE